MLFGNGLSALITLLGISAAVVIVFVIGPLVMFTPQMERAKRKGSAEYATGAGHADRGVGAAARPLLLGHRCAR
jgi:hypothetical protein